MDMGKGEHERTHTHMHALIYTHTLLNRLCLDLRDELRVVVGVVGVNALLAIAQEVLHGCVRAGCDADLVSGAPHLHPHQHDVDVQLTVQLQQAKR